MKNALNYSGNASITSRVLTFRSIWISSFPSYTGPGGGGGSGGGSYFYDDGSRGMNQVPQKEGRQPGCLGEQLYMEAIAAEVAFNRAPTGYLLELVIGDPLYDNGDWRKYQADTGIMAEYPLNQGYKIKKRVTMHYMYNIKTHEVAQRKLKNSYEAGCLGVKAPLGS